MEPLKIEYMPVGALRPYERNARKHRKEDVQGIVNSIQQFGFDDPIGIWGPDNLIVEGHGRLLAAKQLGMETVPCIRLDHLNDEQRRAYALAHNKTAENSEWDFDILPEELESIVDIDMSQFGFDINLDEEQEIVDDEVPEVPEEPRTKLGDIYQLGQHRLICGDSTDPAVIDRLMDGVKADITITSPPYGMGRTAHLRKHLESGKSGRDGLSFYGSSTDDSKSWLNLMNNFYNAAQKAASVHFINVMMVADNKQSLVDFVATHSNDLVDIIVWNKHTCPPQIHEKVLNNGYEFVFVFDNEQNTRAIRFGDFKGTKSNYIETKKEQNQFADIHKAVYSIEFVSKILDICNCAHSVFDPFGGTGTTLIACEQLNRKCYMCELDPKYCDVIVDRWEKFTGEKAVKVNV